MSGELMQPSNMASSVLDKAVATNSTSANQFRFFQRLPPELRMMIWGYALDLEKEHKEVYLNPRGVGPSNCFISPLLLVNWESRVVALRRYPDAHPVYRHLDPGSTPVPVGVVRFNHSDDVLYLHRDFSARFSRLGSYHTPNRTDNILVPSLDAWLYQNPHRCYYIDGRCGDFCLLSDYLALLGIHMSKPGDPPPKQSEVSGSFDWLYDATEIVMESQYSFNWSRSRHNSSIANRTSWDEL
ncbi:hypothetical protein PG991_000988 [Apiospora marii]|uniref:2EXR domain-containing protein n=1 Tax=Apiospora marii TaxID=335849 RepID=A0ABR1STU9_9PEZI